MKITVFIIQSIVLILISPLLQGILRKLKAFMRGYTGPSIIQPYYNLIKLFRKGKVRSVHSSFITSIGPSISIAAAVTSTLLLPVVYTDTDNLFGNLFVIIFILAITKLVNTLIGLDSASTFGGMGTSRELFISMLAEPVMFILIIFLYFETKHFDISGIASINSVSNYNAAHIIAAIAFFIIIIAENARVPVDNPETHLELTMVHEAMILDISGSDLAYLELSSTIKLMAFITVFINCFAPYGIATTLSVTSIAVAAAAYIAKLLICLVVLAYFETMKAKMRLFRVPELLATAFSFSVLAVTINYFL